MIKGRVPGKSLSCFFPCSSQKSGMKDSCSLAIHQWKDIMRIFGVVKSIDIRSSGPEILKMIVRVLLNFFVDNYRTDCRWILSHFLPLLPDGDGADGSENERPLRKPFTLYTGERARYGWRVEVKPHHETLSTFEFDAIVDATGKSNSCLSTSLLFLDLIQGFQSCPHVEISKTDCEEDQII